MSVRENRFKETKKTSTKKTIKKRATKPGIPFWKDKRFTLASGLAMILFGLFLFLSIVSFLITGRPDQSVVESFSWNEVLRSSVVVDNWFGVAGAWLAHYFIYRLVGISAIFIGPYFIHEGYALITRKRFLEWHKSTALLLFFTMWTSLLLGYIVEISSKPVIIGFLCGHLGYKLAVFFDKFAGWGTILVLILAFAVFAVYFFRLQHWSEFLSLTKRRLKLKETKEEEEEYDYDEGEDLKTKKEQKDNLEDNKLQTNSLDLDLGDFSKTNKSEPKKDKTKEIEFTVEENIPTETELESVSAKEIEDTQEVDSDVLAVEDTDYYDPKLDLSVYKYPTLELLSNHGDSRIKVTKEELEENKEKIIQTLSHFKIGITSIKATIGPTVTLYEIVPDVGIKISKIRSLEDDIALSLSALGIRIIAPIPGKGTIGIEVPNKNREMVPISSLISTDKFKNISKELPIALGKTISNEVFITDLAKMPHLLMAGATGQGKSVGLNIILTSLLYKKHPSELKLVLIDPKKVELALFDKIERHFLAALPDAEESIITDTTKAVNVLNSLCIEMDMRYNLLKEAGCRNIKEYNEKFKQRRLNPEKGHRFLPYIVLVVDELADLMMTAGKEVELPIARLAQLARAIGIHLIIATQRPSVDVITGIIKANFPARLSFKVSSKIDSRTILDTGGAEQLIGMGDMLLSNSSEIIRLQCAFVDTEEVENICEYIGSQRGYETAYLLPEYEGEEKDALDVDLSKRDDYFEAAAKLLVTHQQGSTSLIQRKLSLGYNRAGRIIDQLEAAGIVGPFEGSKARQVLIHDEYELEKVLGDLDNQS